MSLLFCQLYTLDLLLEVSGVKAAEDPPTRRITRSVTTSVSGPASHLANLAASTDYRAMWAAREWSPPDKVTDFNCFAAKPVVRTADNPTRTDKSESQRDLARLEDRRGR